MSAWINAFVGTLLIFAIGTLKLGLDDVDAALCVVASNVAGLAALMVISTGMRKPWLRRHVVPGPTSTWLIFLTTYFGLLVAIAPALRSPVNFAWLVVPAMMCTGFAILVYGPIQDRIVAASQHRTRR